MSDGTMTTKFAYDGRAVASATLRQHGRVQAAILRLLPALALLAALACLALAPAPALAAPYHATDAELQGTAYAVLDSTTGELDFVRSAESHANGESGTVTSVSGGTYTGTVYSGFEDNPYSYDFDGAPWYSSRESVKSVKTVDPVRPWSLASWFYGMSSCESMDVARLDTSRATTLRCTFAGCKALASLDVSGFDTAGVTDMYGLVYNCTSLGALDLSGFDTSSVTTMNSAFSGCSALKTLDVSSLVTSSVTDMGYMFFNCPSLATLDVSGFVTSKVTNMEGMFSGCKALASLNVSGFDTSNVTDMRSMFTNCSALKALDVSGFDTSKVTDMYGMFSGCSGLASLNVSGFDTSSVTDMGYMFYNCPSLATLDVSGFVTSKVTDMYGMFSGCSGIASLDVSGFDTSSVTDMGYMFTTCSGLKALDVSGFDTSKVTDMFGMFSGCKSLASLDVSGFDTSKVASMGYMFTNCSGLKALDVSRFVTSKVTDMYGMFSGCSGLASLDVSGFDTSNVTRMGYMFTNCSALKALDVSGFDTSKATSMSGMFSGCKALATLDVSGFHTSNVTDMRSMFTNCSALKALDVSGFDTSKVTNMYGMFSGCSGLASLDLSVFDTGKVSNFKYMLLGCSRLTSLTLGPSFTVAPAADATGMLPTPSTTASGRAALGTWGLGSETAEQAYSPTELAALGASAGALDGTWYAQSAPTFVVTFDANGGTGAMTPQSLDAPGALTANAFARAGYSFCGWNTASDGTGTTYEDGATVSPTADMTLYAQWRGNPYTVRFHANAADATGTMADQSMTYGAETALSKNAFSRDGYYFLGWSDLADGGTELLGADERTGGFSDAQGLVTRDAPGAPAYLPEGNGSCSILKYNAGQTAGTVRIDIPSGEIRVKPGNGVHFSVWTSAKSSDSRLVLGYAWFFEDGSYNQTNGVVNIGGSDLGTWGEHHVLAYDLPSVRNGRKVEYYTPFFAAKDNDLWFTGVSVKVSNNYGDGKTVSNLTTAPGGTVDLYALWVPKVLSVTFDGNGADSGETAGFCMTEDTTNPLTKNGFTRVGYAFTGWNTEADGSGTSYADGAALSLKTPGGGKRDSVTLYAQWRFVPVVVRVPRAISYTGMPVGAVSASESYDVGVECGDAYTVTVTGAATGLSSPAGTLPASCASQSSPLVFDGDGTKRDTVSIGGSAAYGRYEGSVQYSVSVAWKGE